VVTKYSVLLGESRKTNEPNLRPTLYFPSGLRTTLFTVRLVVITYSNASFQLLRSVLLKAIQYTLLASWAESRGKSNHALSEIRTHNPSDRAAADLQLWSRGHCDRQTRAFTLSYL